MLLEKCKFIFKKETWNYGIKKLLINKDVKECNLIFNNWNYIYCDLYIVKNIQN